MTPNLRHRVTLQAQTQAQDATTGEITVTWADTVADEPAEVVPLSGREFLQSNAMQSSVDTRMTIRWRSGIEAAMRVVFDGANYNIHAVLPDPTNRRWLILMCERLDA